MKKNSKTNYIAECKAWLKSQDLAIKSSLNRISHLKAGMAIDSQLLKAEQNELSHKMKTRASVVKEMNAAIEENKKAKQ